MTFSYSSTSGQLFTPDREHLSEEVRNWANKDLAIIRDHLATWQYYDGQLGFPRKISLAELVANSPNLVGKLAKLYEAKQALLASGEITWRDRKNVGETMNLVLVPWQEIRNHLDKQIKAAIKDGKIIFHPYQPTHIAGSSVDVTLGHYFYKQEYQEGSKVYNPFDKDDVDRYFKGPLTAISHKDWCKENGYKLFTKIPADHPIIVLRPGERILAHTHEFIGIKAPGTSTMQARSTWGRNGVAVCLDAGWGDPGYINRWTMEIYNMNQHESVVLPVGERIAQIVFYETGPVDQEYKHLSGKYQTSASDQLGDIIANWSPEQMLPRAHKDVRKNPIVIDGLADGLL